MYSFLAREVAAAVIPLMTADALQEITMLSPNVVISAAEPELSKLIKAVRSVNNGRVIVAAADEDLAQNLGPRPSLLCFKYAQSFPPKTTGGPIMPWARLHGDALNKTNSIDRFIEGCATPWIHDFSKRKVQRLYAVSASHIPPALLKSHILAESKAYHLSRPCRRHSITPCTVSFGQTMARFCPIRPGRRTQQFGARNSVRPGSSRRSTCSGCRRRDQ